MVQKNKNSNPVISHFRTASSMEQYTFRDTHMYVYIHVHAYMVNLLQ